MAPEIYDFSGYATKNDLKCADGRTIRRDAFKDCDGNLVPLVWGHKHGSPGDVLGHAILENRDDGVYTYGVFNDTESGKNAKELVRHGDVKALSIYANQLVQKGGDVLHGMIREVSLCLAGANPGAKIENLSFEHAAEDDSDDFEALIFTGEDLELSHADKPKEEEEKKEPVKEQPKEEPKEEEKDMANENEKTVKDVFDSLTEEQKNVVYFMIGQALEDNDNGEKPEEEEPEVAHNVFENDNNTNALMHDAMNNVLADAIKNKSDSLKLAYEQSLESGELAHAVDTTGMEVPTVSNATYKTTVGYGINGVEFLFPEARTLNDTPEFIKRDTDWVDVVLAGVKKNPFSRIKTIFANITEDEARAKGYIKRNQKKDEFFSLMKRVTTPTTIYKKQKFDRDDIIDITDMNVVAWIKTEMRMMLNEELARAILIGDGRAVSSDDKINEQNIRPIVSDANIFTVKVEVAPGTDDEDTAKKAIKALLHARKEYKGTGNPTFFTTEDWLTTALLAEDQIGRRLYNTEAELASTMRVRKIVPVPVLEGYTDANGRELIGIMVNLTDYVVGTDKGGEINMFDDFDIDFNRYKYLIETRCSGSLVRPYSAVALYKAASSTTTGD